ncbi:TFIIH subunit Tfb4/p34 [Kalaharituber pfeilii]|nr:TFIIH subunit Tfb4/p34 [Kalaharituber pfeilii]
MNAVDASLHYTQSIEAEVLPSLLTVIIDTNPYAWDSLSATLPLAQALANILLFINAHLAFSSANKVAVIASHTKTARMLYPPPPHPVAAGAGGAAQGTKTLVDRLTATAGGTGGVTSNGGSTASSTPGHGTSPAGTGDSAHHPPPTSVPPPDPERDANKYRQFRIVEDHVTAALRALLAETTEESLAGTNMTMMAGALSLALTYIHKLCMPIEETTLAGRLQAGGGVAAAAAAAAGAEKKDDIEMTMNARILVISVSGDLASQYIPIMNCIFAAQRKKIPVDICKIAGDTVFLQQASDATNGIYMHLKDAQGLLQYLMMGFLPDQTSRKHLVLPTQVNVDFRAACFCHKRVVDIGFVCSICLSIFCSPPDGAICTTCGTKLDISTLGHGGKPAVLVVRKKKKKRKADTAAGGTGEA